MWLKKKIKRVIHEFIGSLMPRHELSLPLGSDQTSLSAITLHMSLDPSSGKCSARTLYFAAARKPWNSHWVLISRQLSCISARRIDTLTCPKPLEFVSFSPTTSLLGVTAKITSVVASKMHWSQAKKSLTGILIFRLSCQEIPWR